MTRKWFENLKIKYKLTLSVTIILFLIMVFIYAYFPAKQKDSVYKEMNQRIIHLAKAMALGYGRAMAEYDYAALMEISSWIREDRSFAYYHITDENNEVVDRFPEDFQKSDLVYSVGDFSPVKKGNVIEIKAPIKYKDQFLGELILGMDLKDVNAAVNRINITSTVILFVVFIIAFLNILFISSLINKPIRLLMDSVNRIITHGDYSERVKSESTDEAGILASRFNEMIEMIEERNLELRQQYEELQHVNKLKDGFLAATAHDLRSPITAIMGFSDLIMMNEALDPGDLERLEHIKRSTQFLAKLVNDVLDISQLESGKTELKLSPLSISKIVESSIETLHYMAMPKEITIEFINNSGGKDTVDGDPDALLRILNNLISNAVKFTPNGGRIKVLLQSGEEDLTVSVTDTGIGIPGDKVPIVFDIYSSASRSGTAGEKGTGLGLSITKNLVQKHNGDITVTSREGEGTCFTVTIPLTEIS